MAEDYCNLLKNSCCNRRFPGQMPYKDYIAYAQPQKPQVEAVADSLGVVDTTLVEVELPADAPVEVVVEDETVNQ